MWEASSLAPRDPAIDLIAAVPTRQITVVHVHVLYQLGLPPVVTLSRILHTFIIRPTALLYSPQPDPPDGSPHQHRRLVGAQRERRPIQQRSLA